jgi:hypothetical protein
VKLTTHLHLVPSSKNEWSYTFTPQYAFMAWCSVKAQGQLYLCQGYHHPAERSDRFQHRSSAFCSVLNLDYRIHSPSVECHRTPEEVSTCQMLRGTMFATSRSGLPQATMYHQNTCQLTVRAWQPMRAASIPITHPTSQEGRGSFHLNQNHTLVF